MINYMMDIYVKPAYLDWTIEGIKVILERYGANLHYLSIGKARRSNIFSKKAHEVSFLFDVEPKMLPYIEKRVLKEVGVLGKEEDEITNNAT